MCSRQPVNKFDVARAMGIRDEARNGPANVIYTEISTAASECACPLIEDAWRCKVKKRVSMAGQLCVCI